VSGVSDPIFARIAARYDRINSVLSLGQEKRWRRRGIAGLGSGTVLDLGCGTGTTDFGDREVVGLDPVFEMLELSRVRERVAGVGERLPFADSSFDGVFSGFVFRNLTSVSATIGEIERVLRPGGAAVIVDLARPRNLFLRLMHRVGTAVVLPLAGLVLAWAPREYWYLHRSLDSLPPPEEMYRETGMRSEELWRMGLFGFVYGIRLRKPDE
jgi:demethylmenaquinone methyltransferase/2-methoxy-6-polyprenyl-1,4-benzoquinol methylase